MNDMDLGPWTLYGVAVLDEDGWEVERGCSGWLEFTDEEEAWRYALRLAGYHPGRVRIVHRVLTPWRFLEKDGAPG